MVTRTVGEALDPDGYTIRVDDLPTLTSPSNGSSEIAGLAVGTHWIRLSGVSANCSVTGSNPQRVAVTGDDPVQAVFEIDCPAWAVLEISTVTTGGDPDGDGYALQVDGEPEVVSVAPNATVSLERGAGRHTLTVSDVASNCSVTGADPQGVTVAPGDTARATFEVICTSRSAGRIVVTTHFSGTFADPDGYTVLLDGGAAQPIDITGTVTFSEVAPGIHSVKLTGLAPGCGFLLVNPRTVSVVAGATVSLRFDVICVP